MELRGDILELWTYLSPANTVDNEQSAHTGVGRRNGVRAPGQVNCSKRTSRGGVRRRRKRKRGPRKKRQGRRAGKRRTQYKCGRLRKCHLMVAYCNVRGITGSRYTLEKVMGAYDVILFQETKLSDSKECCIEGWDIIKLPGNTGLAYAIRVNSEIRVEETDCRQVNSPTRKIQLLKVTHPRLNMPVTIANLYMACESAPTEQDWAFLHDLSFNKQAFLIAGDFNARHTSWDITGSNRNGRGLYDAMTDLDLYLLNTGEPTRLAERYGEPDTVLDLALASEYIKDRAIWKRSHQVDSDHFLCEVRIRLDLCRQKPKPKRHLYSKSEIKGVWQKIINFRRQNKPEPITRTDAPNWWTSEVDRAWRDKNRKEKAYERSRDANREDFIRRRIERNQSSALFKQAASKTVREQWDKLCEKGNLNATEYWKFQKSLDSKKSQRRSVLFSDSGESLVTDEEQGTAFLERFIAQCDHNDHEEREHLIQQLDVLVTMADTGQIFTASNMINAINTSKDGAPGPDGISISTMKSLPVDILSDLLNQYSNSWLTGDIPQSWTDAFTGPVPKPGKDHRRLKGHRIIVVQNIIGKIPEKVVAQFITKAIEHILPEGLGGYRPGRETWVNSALLTAEVWSGFERKENTLAVALDLEDAYNCVRLPRLADKMLHIGLPVVCVRWVMSVLKCRRIVMKHGDWKSPWTRISTGLPQGSPLSPVLFNIYTLDLVRIDRPITRVKSFADDVLIHTTAPSKDVIMERITPTLDKVHAWCVDSGMSMNADKGSALYHTLNNRLAEEEIPRPTYQGNVIPQTGSMRYLGTVFDRQLNFCKHVDQVIERAMSGLNVLKSAAGRRAEERHLAMLYKSLVLSLIDFDLPIVQLSDNQVGRLQRLQNSCLRIVTGCTRATPITVLQFLVGVPSIKDRQEAQRAILYAKSLQNSKHGLHSLILNHHSKAKTAQNIPRQLRHQRKPTVASRLKRSSWVEKSHAACQELTGKHHLSAYPAWSKLEDTEGIAQCSVTITLSRECREWTEGAADAKCNELFTQIGGDDALIVATDGSFTAANNRAGWGFAVFRNNRKIADGSGAATLYTSSTRMELEALNQAITWLRTNTPRAKHIILASDSQAVLRRLEDGWFPDSWLSAATYFQDKHVSFVYVPGHAGVRVNEEADRLAALAKPDDKISLYKEDLLLLTKKRNEVYAKEQLSLTDEGSRLVEHGTRYAVSSKSRRKGPSRCHHNQLLTGNISQRTLELVIAGKLKGERVCVSHASSGIPSPLE